MAIGRGLRVEEFCECSSWLSEWIGVADLKRRECCRMIRVMFSNRHHGSMLRSPEGRGSSWVATGGRECQMDERHLLTLVSKIKTMKK